MPARLVVTTAAEGRTPAPLNVVGEATLIKVGPDDTDGQYALFHLVAPPMSGPPLHVHSREDECFYVLDGELVFEVDGACLIVRAGGCVAVTRGMVHRYQNFTDRDVTLLIVTTPGDFAGFFVEISDITPPGGLPTMEQLALARCEVRYHDARTTDDGGAGGLSLPETSGRSRVSGDIASPSPDTGPITFRIVAMLLRPLLALTLAAGLAQAQLPATLTLTGPRGQSRTVTSTELAAMPRRDVSASSHHVTGRFSGVSGG